MALVIAGPPSQGLSVGPILAGAGSRGRGHVPLCTTPLPSGPVYICRGPAPMMGHRGQQTALTDTDLMRAVAVRSQALDSLDSTGAFGWGVDPIPTQRSNGRYRKSSYAHVGSG